MSDTVTIEDNTTYVAQWQPEKGQADYSIVIWGQNANDDEYSYLGSSDAWGNVGKDITWNESTLISHVHADECRKLTCDKEEHTHDAKCYTCSHVHGLTCYGLNANSTSTNPNDNTAWWNSSKPETYFEALGIEDGYLYYDDENAAVLSKDNYYFRFNGKYYSIDESLFNKLKGDEVGKTDDGTSRYTDYYYKYSINQAGMSCTHTHTDDCYSCGKAEHTHDSSCFKLVCGLKDTPKQYMKDIKPSDSLW